MAGVALISFLAPTGPAAARGKTYAPRPAIASVDGTLLFLESENRRSIVAVETATLRQRAEIRLPSAIGGKRASLAPGGEPLAPEIQGGAVFAAVVFEGSPDRIRILRADLASGDITASSELSGAGPPVWLALSADRRSLGVLTTAPPGRFTLLTPDSLRSIADFSLGLGEVRVPEGFRPLARGETGFAVAVAGRAGPLEDRVGHEGALFLCDRSDTLGTRYGRIALDPVALVLAPDGAGAVVFGSAPGRPGARRPTGRLAWLDARGGAGVDEYTLDVLPVGASRSGDGGLAVATWVGSNGAPEGAERVGVLSVDLSTGSVRGARPILDLAFDAPPERMIFGPYPVAGSPRVACVTGRRASVVDLSGPRTPILSATIPDPVASVSPIDGDAAAWVLFAPTRGRKAGLDSLFVSRLSLEDLSLRPAFRARVGSLEPFAVHGDSASVVLQTLGKRSSLYLLDPAILPARHR